MGSGETFWVAVGVAFALVRVGTDALARRVGVEIGEAYVNTFITYICDAVPFWELSVTRSEIHFTRFFVDKVRG